MIKSKVLKYIKENEMLECGDSVIIGVSGGADSMCLLAILIELREMWKLNIHAVHIHHGIRGEEADEDMRYVEEYAKKNGITFSGFRFDITNMAKDLGMSVEEAGRYVRYKTFEDERKRIGADKIAIAHNLGDDVETILLNMFRGTGISGMAGIPVKRERIIRPILCLTREEIVCYLAEKNIKYRTDSTNLENDYMRNKVRNQLIPFIKENINEKADEHIEALGRMIGEADDYMNTEAEKKLESIAIKEEEVSGKKLIELDVQALAGVHKALQSIIIRKALGRVTGRMKDITLGHIQGILSIAYGETGKRMNLPYDTVAVKYPESLIIRENSAEEGVGFEEKLDIEIDEIPAFIKLPEKYRTADFKAFLIENDEYENVVFEEKTYTKWFDYDILKNKIQIRTRMEGDYIVVNSEGGRKKLKDYFIDLKIPRENRDDIIVFADGHEIIWVVGYRINEAYKVKKGSRHIIKVEAVDENI